MEIRKISMLIMGCSIFAMISTSCSDWLDYTPKDKQTYEQQFSTATGFHNAVNGVYTKISSNSLYGNNLSYGALDMMAQLYNISSANTSRWEYKSYTWTGTVASNTFASIWSNAYSTILNANLILNAAEEGRGTVLSENDYKLIKGEMLGVRAFLHFDLLRLFGPVYSKNPNNASIPYNDGIEASHHDRLPADSLIQEKLLPDLIQAEELLLSADPVVDKGVMSSDGGADGNWDRYRQLRMNYYAVCLLEARTHLWAGDYEQALTAARKITDDHRVQEHFPFVDPNRLLANTINPDRIFSTECLFGFYRSTLSDIFLNYFNGALDATQVLQPRAGYIDILFPQTNDYRRQSQWSGSASLVGSEYDFIKYKGFTTSSSNPDFWATFFGLMRISEAYYIASECCMNKDDIKGACSYLNTILQARGLEAIDATAMTKSALLKQIKMEYLREMRGEGQLFYLFKRFNQSFGASTSGGDADLDGAERLSYDTPGTRYVIPIPSEETN